MKNVLKLMLLSLFLLPNIALAKDLALKFLGTPFANVISAESQAKIDRLVTDGLAFN